MNKPIIQIINVEKTYKSGIKAVDNLSFEIYKNEVVGLIGPNGAGKTTTLKIILGLLFPDKGNVLIDGKDIKDVDIKRKIGYLPENPAFPDFMNGRQFLEFHGSLYGIKPKILTNRIDEVLKITGMKERAKDKMNRYSRGMIQRIFLAQAILNDPEVIFLDEPTTALDPVGIIEFRNMILDFKTKGKTILLNSHQLTELEKVCDRIAFINKGKLHRIIEPSTYREGVSEVEVELENFNEELISNLKNKYSFIKERNLFRFFLEEEAFNELLETIIKGKAKILSVQRKKKTLEEVFLQFMEETK